MIHEGFALDGFNRKWDVALALRRFLHVYLGVNKIPKMVLSHTGLSPWMYVGEGEPARSSACLEAAIKHNK